jgi:hypothetical protein
MAGSRAKEREPFLAPINGPMFFAMIACKRISQCVEADLCLREFMSVTQPECQLTTPLESSVWLAWMGELVCQQVCWAVLGGLIVGPVSLFVIGATAVAPR